MASIYDYNVNADKSYDMILSTFIDNEDNEMVLARSNAFSTHLKTSPNYEHILAHMDNDSFKNTGGCDLATLFVPFQTKFGDGSIPCFYQYATQQKAPASGDYNNINLLPFNFDVNATSTVTNRYSATSGDGLRNLVSDTVYRGSSEQFRDISDIRGVALRLPAMGVGWGYTTDGYPWPSGTGSDSTKKYFKGGYENGWEVQPKDYIAAVIDFQYDVNKHVWTCHTPTKPEVLIKITGHAYLTRHDIAIGGGSTVYDVEVSWKYAFTEVKRESDGTFQVVEGGMSGTTDSGWIINLAEYGHNERYAWGVDMTGDSYPRGFRPRPIGGGGDDNTHKQDNIVKMHIGVNTDNTVYYWFDRIGSHDGSCE